MTSSRLGLAAVVLGLAAVVMTVLPASIWKAPADDAVYRGFDKNVMYSTGGGGGSVRITPVLVDLIARPQARPSINLVTTLEPKVRSTVTATVLTNTSNEPLRVGLWSPWTSSGYFIVFGPAPDNEITAELLVNGRLSSTLIDGQRKSSQLVGHYQLDAPYTLSYVVDRTAGEIDASVSPVGGQTKVTRLFRGDTDLFDNVQLSLAASSEGGSGQSRVLLTDFNLTIPHQRWWAVKVDDAVERAIVLLLAGLGALLVLIGAVFTLRSRRFRVRGRSFRPTFPAVLIVGAALIYLAGNASLFLLGFHPFDFQTEELYAYVTSVHGVADLYYLPNFVSLAGIFGGVPFIESAFPYGPVFAYLYGAMGWVMAATSGFAFGFGPGHERIVDLIKGTNVVFGLADAALIFLILRRIGVGKRWTYIGSALFLFNPAVWFNMSVWGQTHVISLFFVLACVYFAERRMLLPAWLALTAALLTRPQMVVFGLLLGIVLLRKFAWRENLVAVSWTAVLTFLALLPLTLAISPSLPVDALLNNFRIQGGGNTSGLSPVSAGGFSIWPLVTFLAHGASGLSRTFAPSADTLLAGLSYQVTAQALTVIVLLALAVWLAVRPRAWFDAGGYLPVVALGVAAFLMLITGVVATHFVLALPFLILCRRWMNTTAYLYVVAIWTVTTFVPMYGELGALLTPTNAPLLTPVSNGVTSFFVNLYTWDRFITLAVVANICAVVWLGWLTVGPRPSAGTGAA